MTSHRGYAVVALDNPKAAENVGSAMRACSVFGAAMLVIGGDRPDHWMRARTDVGKGWRHRPLLKVPDVFDALPFDCVPIAVDLVEGARPLPVYTHPERGFYIFGPQCSAWNSTRRAGWPLPA